MQHKPAQYVIVIATFLLVVSVMQVSASRTAESRPDFMRASASFPDAGIGADAAASAGQQHSLRRDLREPSTSPFPATQPHFTPKTIFGPDDRVQLSPTFAPVSWLVLWDATPAPIATCSGTFIGPRVVLTAAHCIYNAAFGGWIAGADVVPGSDGAATPNGYDSASDVWVPQGWIDGQESGWINWEWDFAILTLESSTLGDRVGWVELAALTTAALSAGDLNPITIGYPGDKPQGTQWMTDQPALASVLDAFLTNELDAFAGQSGSGMFRGSDGKLIGIVSAETASFNMANRVRPRIIADLNAACANLDCWFASSDETTAPPPTPPPTPTPPPPPTDPFDRTWQRTDKPVADGAANRTWMWGPAPASQRLVEDYDESPDGERVVVYYDKSRMEITNPAGNPDSIWFVTNGLLVRELVTGQMQIGNNRFEPLNPANINVAGDPDDMDGPTYATFAALLDDAPLADGATITQRISRTGAVSNDAALASYGVTTAHLVDVPGLLHQVASPFWAFMNSSGVVNENGTNVDAALFENPFYATGYPIAEAYWATVKVGGLSRDVLMQCFERRCLTFTPGNSPEWQVEAGNVGQHYYIWRYGAMP